VAGGGKRHGKVESSSKRTLACLELPNFPDIFPLAYSDFMFIPENTGITIDFFSVHHFDKNFLTGQQRNICTCTYKSVPSEPGRGGGHGPRFGRSLNPNSIMGADYVNHMVLAHPDFQISLRLSLCLALPVCAMFSLGYVT
jgi:hypothetical protein